jgi:hypothetical protein
LSIPEEEIKAAIVGSNAEESLSCITYNQWEMKRQTDSIAAWLD